jgi:hypothetical protein
LRPNPCTFWLNFCRSWPGLGVGTRDVFDVLEDRGVGLDEEQTLFVGRARGEEHALLSELFIGGYYFVVDIFFQDEGVVPELQQV